MNVTASDSTNARPTWPRKITAAGSSVIDHREAAPSHSEFEALVADAEDLVKSTIDSVGGQTAAAREKLQETITNVKERLAASRKGLGRQVAGVVDEYVRARAWKAIAVAALSGVVVGAFVSRR